MISSIKFLIFFTLVQYITGSAYVKVDYSNQTQVEIFNKFVQKVCENREEMCRNVSKLAVCTVRKNNQTNKIEFMYFGDTCRLFTHNLCDVPGKEYCIVSSGTCEEYFVSRRNEEEKDDENTAAEETTQKPVEKTTIGYIYVPNGKKQILRQKQTFFTKKTPKRYGITSAEDGHPCPYHCPNVYEPQCMNVNPGAGLYFNFKIFVNHCEADMFYCKNFNDRERFPMPSEEEDWGIQTSKLSFSACADVRYMQFARFSEATSTMNHFGWLPDHYHYTKILNPEQRRPGYG